MGGRAVEGTGLENQQAFHASRGFESHPIRHILVARGRAHLQRRDGTPDAAP